MSRALLIEVRFGEGRYHGAGDWPPAPARLFQALVAGAARGGLLVEEDRLALAWLERLAPPVIAAPAVRAGQSFRSYVPNNDLDAVGGDIGRIAEIRAAKSVKPLLFNAAVPLLYAWRFEPDADTVARVEVVLAMATRLYQLGRGTDLAWAVADTVDEEEAGRRLAGHGRSLYRPGSGRSGKTLLCPQPGSLKSLADRFAAWRRRFAEVGEGRKKALLFAQPPRPRFRSVSYNSPPVHLLFEIRKSVGNKADPDFVPWPLREASDLVARVRDGMARRLTAAFEGKADLIGRVVIGRNATEADKAQRIRIVALPSIGHTFVDHAIRRVLVEVPPNCPFAAAEVEWAASGLELGVDSDTGEVLRSAAPVLILAQDRRLLDRYGVNRPARSWRTVTPVVLPLAGARRRIEPSRHREPAEWKGAEERAAEEGRASAGVVRALRHAEIGVSVTSLRVQREPFSARGARAEAFAPDTRFAKERLWHVELSFAEAVSGPLLLGDGRYLALGLMQPVDEPPWEVMTFSLPTTPGIAVADRGDLLDAARRALMALSRQEDGGVPPLFSGHEVDGAAARSGKHRHVFLAGADLDGDGAIDRLIVAAPWICDRSLEHSRADAALFERVVSAFATLRAGRLGVLPLRASPADREMTGPAREWESHTDYRPTRHAGRGKEPAAALLQDVVAECERRGLPRPEVDLVHLSTGPKGGVAARLRLRFAVTVSGPVLLGRDSHRGGGLFLAAG